MNKKDSATHSTLPYLNTSISWGVVPTSSVVRRGSETLSLKVDDARLPDRVKTAKQISFQDQDSSSSQSTGQSYTEVASSGDDNPSRQISFSAKSETKWKGFATNPKSVSMTGFQNVHFASPQGMPNLKRLDLSESENLEQLPHLSMAVNLEESITRGRKRLKRISESISSLTMLTKLDLSYCDQLYSCHITIRELSRSYPRIALYFSDNEVEMESIANLTIGGNIHILMLWLDGNADHVCFSTEHEAPNELMKKEQQLPHNKPPLEFSMRTLCAVPEFHGHEPMRKAEQKPEPMSEFHNFSLVHIIRFNYNSAGATFLCYSLSMFPFLKELNLINLNIELIPDDVCGLHFLEKLDWSGNDFETLPETMYQLTRLKYASLCNCRRLQSLPELVQLEKIKLSGCTSLQLLFNISHTEQDWGRFQLLELWIDECKNIESISDQLGNFMKLSYVDLSSNDFETLPSSIGNFSSLRTLCLNKCKKLKSIERVPLCLKHLYAHGCESLERISLPLNHSVQHLDLSHCFCLKQVEHLISQFLNGGETKRIL